MPDHAPAGRWWHGAVLYQLYVRSWQDSNGDGYGDLPGLLSRLDHLSWLGVDAIWLSPTMPSPDQDWGYDVSDYLGVHPELGTLADLDELISVAGSRGMRVLLDLVPNHTSSAHPWFADALSGRDAEHREYYVWAGPAAGGGPPNNWIDFTGAPAWTWHEPTGQYYLHNFLPAQPDLNWWHEPVHEEFARILEFWFARGVAGFRIDVAHGLYKDKLLRDNPPLREGGTRLSGAYGLQAKYNVNQPEVHGVYRDWRAIADRYDPPRLLLGETWVSSAAELAPFYGQDDELQLGFNFPFVFADFTADALAGVAADTAAGLPPTACPVWTASNHDVGRFATRWCGGDPRKIRLALLIMATLPGAFVLYYGDEIGLPDVAVPPELERDPMTAGGLGGQLSRDRARTPMLWDASASGGFTAGGVRPWLPLGDPAACNVAAQRDDPDSLLTFTRALIRLRKAEATPDLARYQQLTLDGGLWVYRVGPLLVAANLAGTPATVSAPAGQVLMRTGEPPAADSGITALGPWEGLIARAG
jgi:alpha-glucosidase